MKKKKRRNRGVDDQECVRLNQLVDIAISFISMDFFRPKENEEYKNTD